MRICKVIKPLVSTNRIPGFEHKHLKVVQDGSSHLVAVDAVGCRDGDWVICVSSSAAREAAGSKSYPSDLTIVGIIDHWDPPQKSPASSSASAQASASSSATSQAPGAPAPSPIQTPDNQTGGSDGGAG